MAINKRKLETLKKKVTEALDMLQEYQNEDFDDSFDQLVTDLLFVYDDLEAVLKK